MANYNGGTTDIVNAHDRGYAHGFGGGGVWLLLGVIVLWFLFRDGHRGHGGGHDGHNGHNGAFVNGVRAGFYDESNYEQERNLERHMARHDVDTIVESEKTRKLIADLDRESLRDKIAERDAIIATQRSEAFSLGLFGRLEQRINEIACGLPKVRPQYAATVTPCLGELPSCTPQRGGCPEFV